MKRELFQHLWIRLRLRHWIGPALCALPYLASIAWLFWRSQPWIAALMLAPAVMMVAIAAITLALARLEFHGSLRRPGVPRPR